MSINQKVYSREQQDIIDRKRYIQDSIYWKIKSNKKNYDISSKNEILARKKYLEQYMPKKDLLDILEDKKIDVLDNIENELYNFIDSLNTNIYTCINFIESQNNNIREFKNTLSDIIWEYISFKSNFELKWEKKILIKIQTLSIYISKLTNLNDNISWTYEFHIHENEILDTLDKLYKSIKSLSV